jgi:hypothetical protein
MARMCCCTRCWRWMRRGCEWGYVGKKKEASGGQGLRPCTRFRFGRRKGTELRCLTRFRLNVQNLRRRCKAAYSVTQAWSEI